MLQFIEKGALSVGFALAVLAGSAQAQIVTSSLQTTAQRAPLTAAQLDQIMASSQPAENLVSQNPLAARTVAPPLGQVDSQLRSSPSPGLGAPSTPSAVTSSVPQFTQARAGRPERVGVRFMNMYEPPESEVAGQNDAVAPEAFGQGNWSTIYHYNDYLQVPFPVTYAPWRQAGYYLFQAADGLWYHCTAALINRAILVTAGHCVHDGSGTHDGWNQDGYFYPGYTARFDRESQRYGYCQTTFYATTLDWFNTGQIQQGTDVAMALCGELTGGAWTFAMNRLPGVVLGWFGFCYLNCLQPYNFMTQIGYPGNYYGGEQMTISQHIEETALSEGRDYLYGTGMRGGSSGGPHVQNIGWINDSSSFLGYNRDRNVIVAVTSWGYVSDAYKLQGASALSGYNNNIDTRGMFNIVCQQSRALHGNFSCSLMPTP